MCRRRDSSLQCLSDRDCEPRLAEDPQAGRSFIESVQPAGTEFHIPVRQDHMQRGLPGAEFCSPLVDVVLPLAADAPRRRSKKICCMMQPGCNFSQRTVTNPKQIKRRMFKKVPNKFGFKYMPEPMRWHISQQQASFRMWTEPLVYVREMADVHTQERNRRRFLKMTRKWRAALRRRAPNGQFI